MLAREWTIASMTTFLGNRQMAPVTDQGRRAGILRPAVSFTTAASAPARPPAFPALRLSRGFSSAPPAGHRTLPGSPVRVETARSLRSTVPGFQNLPGQPGPYREQTGQTGPATVQKNPAALSSSTSFESYFRPIQTIEYRGNRFCRSVSHRRPCHTVPRRHYNGRQMVPGLRFFGPQPFTMHHSGACVCAILEPVIFNLLIKNNFFALAHPMLQPSYAIRTIDVRGGSIYQGESNETCDSDHQAFQIG